MGSAFAEGLYVLFTTDPKDSDKHAVLRVEVTDVAEGSVFTLKTGAQAASRVQKGDLARLLRPSPISTARLRALPDENMPQFYEWLKKLINDPAVEVVPSRAGGREPGAPSRWFVHGLFE